LRRHRIGRRPKTTLFILNRDLAKPHTVRSELKIKPQQRRNATTLTGSDLKAFNTFDSEPLFSPTLRQASTATNAPNRSPARSYTAIQWGA